MMKFFAILMLGAACAVAQTVEGSVVNSVSGIGIAGVKVEIAEAGKTAYTVTTDRKGHFLVEEVKAGSYTVHYATPDYWRSDTQGKLRLGPERFEVTAGGNPVKLEARMMPLARITGHVVDTRGDAVPKAGVRLTGSGMWMSLTTDAKGKFEIHNFLFPGAYTLSVAPPPGFKPPDREPDSDRVLNWTRTYYPGVAFAEAASKIVVRPGGEVWDVELKLLAVAAHTVRGVLLNPDGTPAPKVEITLGEGPPYPPVLSTESKPDGTFEFPAVVDGESNILAKASSQGVALQAMQWIEMTGHETEGVTLRLSPAFTVRGKVVMETPHGAPAPKPPSAVYLGAHVSRTNREVTTASGGPQSRSTARPDANGSFSLENVYPGAYRISASPPPPGYYLDAIRVGEVEVTTPEVEWAGPVSLTLVYKTNGGAVRGRAEKCASGTVWLVPRDTTMRRLGFVPSATCDPNDHYDFTAVRPGEYYTLALASDSRLWYPGIFDDGVLNQASKVTVRAGETSSADFRAIMRPAY